MATILTDETVVSSCSLAVKINKPLSTGTENLPEAAIEVSLFSRGGDPIAGQEIKISATNGTFLCNSASSDDRSCFTTDSNGKALINLVNIPYNSQVRVKASYDCGNYQVYATGNVLISKKTFKKK